MNIFEHLPKPFLVLAPMDEVTDTVFRRIVGYCAPPDLYFTEFVNVDGLQSLGRSKLLKKLRFTAQERPLIAQIWGKNSENYYKTAQQLADGSFAREVGLPEGINFAGVDINMGCPDKTIVKNGSCAALINNRALAADIIKAAKDGLSGRLPLSVKTRTGFQKVDMTWIEFLLGHHLQALTIHARTKVQMSKVPAEWDIINQARELRDQLAPDTLIIGNGDVMSRQQALELARRYNLDGIMVGRGIFQDPFAFAEQSPWATMTPKDRLSLYRQHIQLFGKTWHSTSSEGERPVQTLNKFCKIYINGFDGAKELREQLMNTKSIDELTAILDEASSRL